MQGNFPASIYLKRVWNRILMWKLKYHLMDHIRRYQHHHQKIGNKRLLKKKKISIMEVYTLLFIMHHVIYHFIPSNYPIITTVISMSLIFKSVLCWISPRISLNISTHFCIDSSCLKRKKRNYGRLYQPWYAAQVLHTKRSNSLWILMFILCVLIKLSRSLKRITIILVKALSPSLWISVTHQKKKNKQLLLNYRPSLQWKWENCWNKVY